MKYQWIIVQMSLRRGYHVGRTSRMVIVVGQTTYFVAD